MTCTSCGAENEAGRQFCLNCGQRLAAGCPVCGSSNTPGAKFCGKCGNPLPAGDAMAPRPAGTMAATAPAATTPAAATPATERRRVSVLFADLVGFTTLSEKSDAEDVRELLGRYFEACRDVVERYGGTVEKFIGDAVMAVWGTPTAQEDDAERAVRAALELVESVRHLSTESGMADLGLRAAVHTGEAVVTIGASGMGMVAGDLVNTASRLQAIAAPGTVLVGEGTQRAARNAIAFEEAGPQTLRGKASPVPAFRALRVVAQRGGVGRSEQLEPPFVGRDAELQLIKDFYHATAREPGPRLVSVLGQAGIGKTRLSWEFLKYIDGVTESVYWHQGRSPAYGEGISFWALGEMVRMRLAIGEGADDASTRASLSATLDEFVTDADERRSLEAPLLHLLGIGESQGFERGQLFVAWRTFFERIADMGPVVMVFEDLQWADDGMLDFIEELAAWSRGRSIYIITLARPELLDRRATWGAGLRSFTSLSLAPLVDAEMRALLAGLVPGLPETVTDQIVGRSEGVPLYAVEMVRTLLNDGRIQRDGDAFRPVGDLSELAVPESLHALIAARIDALPAPERSLVQDASVLGLSLSTEALAAVARSTEEMEPMLQHLVQRELLTIDDDPRSPERGQYRFVQGLVREVAYGTLSRDDRRARHLAAARFYEALGDDELSGVLAQHYVDAYQAHPDGPEGTAVAIQARVALRGAAERARALGSPRLAHSYLQSALVVVSDPAEELEIRQAAGFAAADAGLFDAGIAHCERAIDLATELGDAGSRRRFTAFLGQVLTEGRQDQALQLLREAYAEPGLRPEDPGFVELADSLAKTEMRAQNDAVAMEITERALPVAEAAGPDWATLQLIITRGVCLSNLHRPTEAVTVLAGAWELAQRRGLAGGTRAAVNLGYALEPEDPRRGFEISRAGLERDRRIGNLWGVRYLLGNAADGALEVGEWDWALAQIDEQLEQPVEAAERLWYGAFATEIRAYRGEPVQEEARRLYEQSQPWDDVQYRGLGKRGLMAVSLVGGRLDEVIRLVDEQLALGSQNAAIAFHGGRAAIWSGDLATARRLFAASDAARPGRGTDADIATLEAGIAQLEGRTGDARARYADAQRLLRELGLDFRLAQCDLEIVITGAMEADERRRAADEAREIFTRLRATALLDRLDAALATEAPAAEAATRPSEVEAEVEAEVPQQS
ncbi:MAG: adenylate/guanylate cyclase domain-containing protein [Candidatus Limnocylindria bacterium]